MQLSVSGAGRGHDEGLRVGYKSAYNWYRNVCNVTFCVQYSRFLEHFLHSEGQKHNC